MNRIHIAFLSVVVSLLTSCAYRGAIYSEYSQCALDIRASAQDANGPVKVNFGYDRAVLAYIPKRNSSTNSSRGEAVSVVSWNNTSTTWVPPSLPSAALSNALAMITNSVVGPIYSNKLVKASEIKDVIRVDAGFISGTAANIATVPSGYNVVVRSDSSSTNVFQVTTSGDRLALASVGVYGKAIGSKNVEINQMIDDIVNRVSVDGVVDGMEFGTLLKPVDGMGDDTKQRLVRQLDGKQASMLTQRLSTDLRDYVKKIHNQL
ncbi:MAG: hypothetical protein ABSH14_16350 [Verrucomicrobiia bacterium]